ncbi:MAG: formylglycine-generating enzyme family protein [Rhodobacteraceae bacterium]|nr:formylglycine-generating enzyme family protein [Paracoccaceae bacterium]
MANDDAKQDDSGAGPSGVSALIAAAAAGAERTASAAPGSMFRDMDAAAGGFQAPEMVVIPPGRFWMGSPEDEPGRRPVEGPRRQVTIARPFALGVQTVSFEEYDAFAAAMGAAAPDDRGWGRGRRPVIHVSCEDAEAYCQWLSEQTGAVYRLPTEAEWEHACRAGTQTPFWGGREITPDQANYNSLDLYDGRGRVEEPLMRTLPADAFEPSPWGLRQMHGNVFEWCADVWNGRYDDAPGDGSAQSFGRKSYAPMRGGSWSCGPPRLRSAYRGCNPRTARMRGVGFRVARTL